ncbi:MAG: DUF1559 domain-containing protein [Cryobacterium sp.]|nr:DUF1559 domain-containing protein [Cryobacterium sp.]
MFMSRVRSTGMTLIELLIVIVIIAILLSLIIPAVQQARESARRAQCRNHLKQLGLAFHNYESSHGTLPIGSRRQNGFGPSWWVGLLPYIGQGSLAARFDHDGVSNGHPAVSMVNGGLVDNLKIPIMRCPSSTLPEFLRSGAFQSTAPSYVGISGATNGVGFAEDRINSCCLTLPPLTSGQISAGGVLVPNRSVTISEITDGTSYVIIVGEASGPIWDGAGIAKRIDAAYLASWITGTAGSGTPPLYTGGTQWNALPAYNITTINHSPNTQFYDPSSGMHENHGANNPLTSLHAGGVHVLLCDGSVRFVSDSINLITLKQISTRDDSSPVASFLP